MEIRHSYHPPPGGSAWTADQSYGLLYLAWGERRYGKTPLREEICGDWVYVAPRSGSPLAVLNGQPRRLRADQCLIVGPGCSSGYEDEPCARCLIQTWVWRDPPCPNSLLQNSDSFRILPLSLAQKRELEVIHVACRNEVQHPDAYTGDALGILRRRIDLCLARGQSGRGGAPVLNGRLPLALRWIKEHLNEHAPVRGICEYLQVSPSTLHRMFLAELGHGPREEALRMRLAEANRLIHSEGWSVKAAAYQLGYKHANDLSRTMSRDRQKS